MPITFVQTFGDNNKSSGTSFTVTVPAGGCAAGNTLIVVVNADNVVLGPSQSCAVADDRGNTYTQRVSSGQTHSGAGDGLEFMIFTSKLTTALQANDLITITLAIAVTAKAATVAEFSGVNIVPDQFLDNGQFPGTTPTGLTITPDAAGTLMFGIICYEGPIGDSYTEDTDTVGGSWNTLTAQGTTGGSATTNIAIKGAYKIVTGTSAQTYNPTIASRDFVAELVAFNEAVVPVTAELYENGSLVQSLGVVNVADDGIYEVTWNAALLSDPTGANVELRLSAASTVQYGAIEWREAGVAVPATPIAASDTIAVGVTDASQVVQTVSIEASDTLAVELVETRSRYRLQYLRPVSDFTVVGTFTNELATTTNLYASIDEVTFDDADYVASPTTPALEDTYRAALDTTATEPEDRTNHVLRYRIGKSATGGKTIDVSMRLRDTAGTIYAEWTHLDIDAATTYEQTMTVPEAEAITNYGGLVVTFDPTATGGGPGRSAILYWTEFQAPQAIIATPIFGSEDLTVGVTDTAATIATQVVSSDDVAAVVLDESQVSNLSTTTDDIALVGVDEAQLSALTTDTDDITLVSTVEATTLLAVLQRTDTLTVGVSETADAIELALAVETWGMIHI